MTAMDPESVSDQSRDLPVELMERTPRTVRMTGTGWLNVFAATLFSLLGVAFAASIVKEVEQDAATQSKLRQNGAESSGRVKHKWVRGSARHIDYEFAVDGTTYDGKSEVPVDIWDGLHQDDTLPIRYLPANPSINHPAVWEDSTFSRLWAFGGPVFLAIFGFLFVRRFPLQRRLAKEGVPVRGTITEGQSNRPGRSQPGVSYTFRNPTNDEVETGNCPCERNLTAGTTVWVLCMPTNPSRSEIYPFGIDFFRIVQ